MATEVKLFDVECVMEKVEELLQNELHIVENDERLRIWQTLYSNGSVKDAVGQLIEVYSRLHEEEAKKSGRFAEFTFRFFSDARKTFKESYILTTKTEATQSSATTTTTATPTESAPETKRGLLSLGGGCMGEIWKVSKRRRKNTSLSDAQRTNADTLYRMSFELRMSSSEKQSDDVPVGIKIRDRTGGLFVPKMVFVPFIRTTTDVVMQYATKKSFEKFGKGMLKVCMAEVTNTVALWELFNTACSEVIPVEQEENRKLFFSEWVRKMVHARLGEFISAYTAEQAEKSGKRLKGGQTLRDELFSKTTRKHPLTSKRKKQAPTTKSKQKGQSKTSSKGKMNVRKTKLDLEEKDFECETDQPSTSDVSRPKRRRVRSRLLDDFTD